MTDDLPAWLEAQADGWGWLDTESPRRLRAAAARLRELEKELAEDESVIILLRNQRDKAEKALDLLRGKDPLDKFTGTE